MKLTDFLAEKPLFYTTFDPERIKKVWTKIKGHFTLPPIIHIVGTNGKGTTGRFLAEFLYAKGKRTGHYTSPHITRFNERIWLNGSPCDDAVLEEEHTRLLAMLEPADAQSLSYFEYTTLLAAAVYEKRCDYIVMEAGLGGEYDATSVFEPVLMLLTPVGIDHKEFLGETVEAITSTKLGALRSNLIVAFQNDPAVYEIAAQKAAAAGKEVRFVKEFFDRTEAEDYLDENRLLAVVAARYLGFWDADKEMFPKGTLFGRFSRFSSNVTVDVGHNVLAAQAIGKRLGKRKVKLVYNTLEDKDYETILRTLKPNISTLEIIPIQDTRALSRDKLIATIEKLNIDYCDFNGINETDEYLVFGSFKTVEAFCKRYNEK